MGKIIEVFFEICTPNCFIAVVCLVIYIPASLYACSRLKSEIVLLSTGAIAGGLVSFFLTIWEIGLLQIFWSAVGILIGFLIVKIRKKRKEAKIRKEERFRRK